MNNSEPLKSELISATKTDRLTILLMMIPFIMLGESLIQSLLHISLPPWSLLQQYSSRMSEEIRFGIFAVVVIFIPITVVLLNIFSIITFKYNRNNKIFNISFKIRLFNFIVIAIAGILAALFIYHTFSDYIRGIN